jgi:hypothetical protein
MFTSTNPYNDFITAESLIPITKPAKPCYIDMPLIQTAYVLYIFSKFDVFDNEFVNNSYQSIIKLRLPDFDINRGIYGFPGWCSIGCFRNELLKS